MKNPYHNLMLKNSFEEAQEHSKTCSSNTQNNSRPTKNHKLHKSLKKLKAQQTLTKQANFKTFLPWNVAANKKTAANKIPLLTIFDNFLKNLNSFKSHNKNSLNFLYLIFHRKLTIFNHKYFFNKFNVAMLIRDAQ